MDGIWNRGGVVGVGERKIIKEVGSWVMVMEKEESYVDEMVKVQ